MIKTTAIYVPGAPRRRHPPMYEMVAVEPHSQYNQDRRDHYHEEVIGEERKPGKPGNVSGVNGNKRINELNPTRTLPPASTVNTETMGPG